MFLVACQLVTKPVRCEENIAAVLMSVEATPKKSVRRRSAELWGVTILSSSNFET